MVTEYFNDTTSCPSCKRWINLNHPNDPGPEKCPHCGHVLRKKNENKRKANKKLPPA